MAKINVHLQSINAQIIHLFMTMKGRIYAFEGGVQKKKTATTGKKNNVADREPALFRVPAKVVNNGLTLEWAHGNTSDHITPAEVEAIKAKTKYKSVDIVRATRIKSLMRTMSYSKIVRHFEGKKGYSARTIWPVYAALSEVGER